MHPTTITTTTTINHTKWIRSIFWNKVNKHTKVDDTICNDSWNLNWNPKLLSLHCCEEFNSIPKLNMYIISTLKCSLVCTLYTLGIWKEENEKQTILFFLFKTFFQQKSIESIYVIPITGNRFKDPIFRLGINYSWTIWRVFAIYIVQYDDVCVYVRCISCTPNFQIGHF